MSATKILLTLTLSLLISSRALAVGSVHFISLCNHLDSAKSTNSNKTAWKKIDNNIFAFINDTKVNQSTSQAVDEILGNEKTNTFPEFSNKFSSNALKYIYEHSELKESNFVKATKTIEKSLQAGVEIKNEKAEISHKVDFNVDAFKNSAKLAYSGLIDCNLTYNYAASRVDFNINEKISENSAIVISHKQEAGINQDQISYNIAF